MDRSALNGALRQWQFYGQGNKLSTFPTTCVRASDRVRQKMGNSAAFSREIMRQERSIMRQIM